MKIVNIFLLFIPIVFFCQSQKNPSDLIVKYSYESVKDTTQIDNKNSEIMVLAMNRTSSIYYSDKYQQALDLMKKKMEMALSSNTTVEVNGKDFSMPKVKHSVFRLNSDIFVSTQLGRDLFTFKSNFLKWNVDFIESIDILGYKCNKAIIIFNGRLYTAWYTKEIPFFEGPYRFKGLPGLILHIEDEKGFDKFKAVSIEKSQIEIAQLQKGIPVSREEYIKKREEYKQNPFPEKNLTPQQRNQIIENQKKVNNTLER
ncbi:MULTISPECIES: GLPGLI family protein [Chryseobacterium]|uniref:GLPGLI family protein n=1 Tax=Chryseobacterium taihuense TaxID=1141221 RepID=A0A1G9PMD9_9FLAO|nr:MULTISPECIES: GLPGLI family protein [Chryseobacterium]MXS71666.1 GLPGLI family protein [Flavobacteriaceae bacterium W22]QQV03810.1 GLPGLI family protein [Chryseobacterium sp. FDAARGOS 1104]SDL99255.1 GLPGLI family protein [Chryseobacterium taihuense]VFB02847.1 GLPGLI family protein [Chryseobacterium taihuense]